MKKFILIPLMALAAIFMSVDVQAQQIKNGTNCPYQIDAVIAPAGTCTPVPGFITVTANPGVITTIPVPPGFDVIGYRGYEVTPFGTLCPAFKVGEACLGLPATYTFSCVCGGTADYFPGTGVRIQ